MKQEKTITPRMCVRCGLVQISIRALYCTPCNRQKQKEWTKAWSQKNPAKIREYKRKQNSFPSSIQAKARWRQKNRDLENERTRQRRKAHPEKTSALSRSHYHNRKSRGAGLQHRHSARDILNLKRVQRDKCANPVCQSRLSDGYHVDHIVPVSKGGSNLIGNIQLLCPTCNLTKSNKDPEVWFAENGVLALY